MPNSPAHRERPDLALSDQAKPQHGRAAVARRVSLPTFGLQFATLRLILFTTTVSRAVWPIRICPTEPQLVN